MIKDIQEYVQKDGRIVEKIICKNGFFYIDKRDLDIIESHTFEVQVAGGQTNIVAPRTQIKVDGKWHSVTFAQLYALKYFGALHPDNKVMDHKNGVELDNISSNLQLVTTQQNGYNQFKQGYTINLKGGANGATHTNYFATTAIRDRVNNKKITIRPFPVTQREDVVAKQQYMLENDWFKQKYPQIYYAFDFPQWRRNDIAFVQEEREGKFTNADVVRRFLCQDEIRLNPWYWCRYNLFELYAQYGISYPHENRDWYLDEDGAMRFKNDTLCRPFNWGINTNRVNK